MQLQTWRWHLQLRESRSRHAVLLHPQDAGWPFVWRIPAGPADQSPSPRLFKHGQFRAIAAEYRAASIAT